MNTPKFESFKKKSRRRNLNSNLLINSKTPPKSFELFRRAWYTASLSHIWMQLCRHFHTALPLRMYLLRWVLDQPPRFLLTQLCRRLNAVEFFIDCNFSNDRLDCQGSSSVQCGTDSVSPPQSSDTPTICNPSSSSLVRDGHVHTMAPHVLLQPPPGLEEYAPPPGFEKSTHLCASHGIPVKAAPVRPRLFTAFSVTPPQPPVSTTHEGTHLVGSVTTGKRSASTALAGTHNSVDADHRAGTGPFPKPRALVLPLVNFGQSNLKGMITLIQLTVISCITNIDFLSFSGTQVRRAGILLILFQLPVVSFMRLFFRKPVIMFRTSLSSSLCAPATRTSLSCSTRTPLSLTL